jgi:quinol monooxygenase YgiN
MVKHIVFWRFKKTAAGQTMQHNMNQVKRQLEALSVLPGVITAEVGFDILHVDASCDVVLYSTFENQAALDAYQQHPDHVAIKKFLGEVTEARYVVDYVL